MLLARSRSCFVFIRCRDAPGYSWAKEICRLPFGRHRNTAKGRVAPHCNRSAPPNELAGTDRLHALAATPRAGIALAVRTSGSDAVHSTKGSGEYRGKANGQSTSWS